MAFQLTPGTSTPARDIHSGGNEDTLVHALHAAFHSFGSHTPSQLSQETDASSSYSKDKQTHMNLEISVVSDHLPLRGTGVDVEPAMLAGHVVLYLTEPTSIKEITLQFRGKARIPVGHHDPMVLNNSPSIFIVCNHEWSFLEGAKKHSHTLKPGRHLFPFELSIGGSLPSSLATYANGGASVSYKLRATAVRPGLVANLTSTRPIVLLRSFAPEALEYQQTLEIENTWPEKLMYNIMVPHKAWAAGDDLTTLVKFLPLAKGVRVVSVTTFINETTKTFCRTGHIENTRSLVTKKHNIIGRQAVGDNEHHRNRLHQLMHHSGHSQPLQAQSAPNTPLHGSHRSNSADSEYFSSGVPSGSNIGAASGPSTPFNTSSSPLSGSPLDVSPSSTISEDMDIGDDEIVTRIVIQIPKTMTPTHPLDPIIVSHRIRWSILISNSDGHTSELRCSLPLHILDHSLIDEAKNATAATRRLLLGGSETDRPEDDMELPSYPAHVQDRVANFYLPESATRRVTNPWVRNHVDPVNGTVPFQGGRTPGSGFASPLEAHYIFPQDRTSPDSGVSTPLEWVNSELLLSLSDTAPPPPTHDGTTTRSPPGSSEASQPGSRGESRRQSRRSSRANSRAASPERGAPSAARAEDTHVHTHNPSSRQPHGLFHMSMKPLTGLAAPWASHTSSRAHAPAHAHTASAELARAAVQTMPSMTDTESGAALLHRAFTEVPTYNVANRGFLGGGVPPLESMRGLPSYEEARSASDSDLVAHFSRAPVQMPGPDPEAARRHSPSVH